MRTLLRFASSSLAVAIAAYPLALGDLPIAAFGLGVACGIALLASVWLANELLLRVSLAAVVVEYGMCLRLADRGFDAGAFCAGAAILLLLELGDRTRLLDLARRVERAVLRERWAQLTRQTGVAVGGALVVAIAAGASSLGGAWVPLVGAVLASVALRVALRPPTLRQVLPPPMHPPGRSRPPTQLPRSPLRRGPNQL